MSYGVIFIFTNENHIFFIVNGFFENVNKFKSKFEQLVSESLWSLSILKISKHQNVSSLIIKRKNMFIILIKYKMYSGVARIMKWRGEYKLNQFFTDFVYK